MLSMDKMALVRTFFVVTVVAALGAVLPPSSAQESTDEATEGPAVAEIAVGTDVVERELVGEATAFPAGTESLVCWTDIRDAAGQTVTHAWMQDGVTRARVEMEIGSDRWRCWSRKRLLPEWTGSWEVKVLTADGAVLASTSFTVE